MFQTMIILQNIGKVEVLHTVICSNVQLAELAGFAECTCLQKSIIVSCSFVKSCIICYENLNKRLPQRLIE